jgi:hypothetical protein
MMRKSTCSSIINRDIINNERGHHRLWKRSKMIFDLTTCTEQPIGNRVSSIPWLTMATPGYTPVGWLWMSTVIKDGWLKIGGLVTQ